MAEAINNNQVFDEIQSAIIKANNKLLEAKSQNDVDAQSKYSSDIRILASELNKFQVEGKIVEQQSQDALKTSLASPDILKKDVAASTGDIAAAQLGGMGTIPSFSTKVQTYTDAKVVPILSQILNAPEEAIDAKSGFPLLDRASIGMAPTESDKQNYLVRKYGQENVTPVNIGGQSNYAIKTGDGKITLFDEIGPSAKDIADVSGAVLPTTAAIAAAITTAGTTANPFVVSAAANGAYFGVSGIQDALVREVMGERIQPMEIAARRGFESGIGMAIDLATAGTGRFISRRIGKGVINQYGKAIADAEQVLKSKGMNVEMSPAAEFGPLRLESQQRYAASSPNSGEAVRLNKNLNVLADYQSSLTANPQTPAATFDKVVGTLRAEYDDLVKAVESEDKKAAAIIRKSLDDKLTGISNFQQWKDEGFQKEPLGNALNAILTQGKEQVNELKTKAFTAFYDAADRAGAVVTPKEASTTLKKAISGFKGIKTNPEVDRIVGTLDQMHSYKLEANRIERLIAQGKEKPTKANLKLVKQLRDASAPLDMRTLNLYVQTIQDAVPGADAIGGKSAQQVASTASGALRDLRDSVISKKQLGKQFADINAQYANDVLLFERQSPGAILKERLGDTSSTPSQMVDRAISDPSNVDDVLRAVGLADPNQVPQFREQLQRAYLDKIGLTSRHGPSDKIDFNPEIIQKLYGVDVNGAPNVNSGKLMVGKLQELEGALKDSKLNLSNVKGDEVDSLFKSLSQQEREGVIKSITSRLASEKQADLMLENTLIKLAKKGEWGKVDNDEFARAMFNAPIQDVRTVIGKMPQTERLSLNADFASHLFSRYPSNGQMTKNGIELWNADAYLADLKSENGKELQKKITEVLGKDFLDTFTAASTALSASKMPTTAQQSALAGISARKGAVPAMVSRIYGGTINKLMGAAYSTGRLKPFLRLIEKDVGFEKADENLKRLFYPLVTTNLGIRALTHQSRNDPKFAEANQTMLNMIPKEEENFKNTYETE
jgi:stage V sporulation protein SpoVS